MMLLLLYVVHIAIYFCPAYFLSLYVTHILIFSVSTFFIWTFLFILKFFSNCDINHLMEVNNNSVFRPIGLIYSNLISLIWQRPYSTTFVCPCNILCSLRSFGFYFGLLTLFTHFCEFVVFWFISLH